MKSSGHEKVTVCSRFCGENIIDPLRTTLVRPSMVNGAQYRTMITDFFCSEWDAEMGCCIYTCGFNRTALRATLFMQLWILCTSDLRT